MFTYFQSAVGAFLLHIATSTQLYGNGKVFGCSSMLYNTFASPSIFNLPAVAGIVSSVVAVAKLLPQYLPSYDNVRAIAPVFGSYSATLLLSGFLTGAGTHLGSGCTSGHMLCGLARLSVRSLVATATFSLVGMITQAIFHTAPACVGGPCHEIANPAPTEVKVLLALLAVIYTTSLAIKKFASKSKQSETIVSYFSGFVFGLGLLISGMGSPGNTLGFLAAIPPKFNPSLIMVVLFGIVPNLVEILRKPLVKTQEYPTAVENFDLPTKTQVDAKLVAGAALFGVGWGLSGICPGPGIILATYNGLDGLYWLAAFLTGYKLMKSANTC
ncbi:uncharacterized protein SAPINGB_P000902 [Magnusiomyces paraingens]|uniref:Sulphur transport domain-containing protein n=1 Tax=Magnusiomyces paraingens TaxID=2606893 RepID=A0A5E8B3K0_9ASCO|nr:uncharacterized protein SAPINGB_P000902 [Saprochaete ingens]VVT45810.1 unnamed protein product [Saprochaete ingens]